MTKQVKPIAFFVALSGIALSGCTTIGQQITNKNGTIAINQPSVENTPAETQRNPVVTQKPPSRVSPEPLSQNSQEYEYQSRRVVGSYIVVQ